MRSFTRSQKRRTEDECRKRRLIPIIPCCCYVVIWTILAIVLVTSITLPFVLPPRTSSEGIDLNTTIAPNVTTTLAPTTIAATTIATTTLPLNTSATTTLALTTTSATTTTATTTLAPTTSATTTTATTTLAPTTTATTTLPSVTTTGVATRPGFPFTISCPSNFIGELELFNLTGPEFIGSVIVTGTGCSNNNVTVTVQGMSSSFFRTERQSVTSRSNGNVTALDGSNYTMVVSSNHTVILGPLPTYTNEIEIYEVTGQNVTLGMGGGKRDLFAHPTAQISYFPTFGALSSGGGLFNGVNAEFYGSLDGGRDWKMSVDSSGFGLAAIYPTTPTWGPGVLLFTSVIFPSQCEGGAAYPNSPRAIRFDHAANRFVIFVLNPTLSILCVAVSATNVPSGSWAVNTFTNTEFTHLRGFEFSIWGDFYTMAWVKAGAIQRFAVLDRLALLAGNPAAAIAVYTTNLYTAPATFEIPPLYPLHQGPSVRGTFLSIDSPCGAWALLDDGGGQTIRLFTCTGLNFTTSTVATFTEHVIPVVGGWSSGHNLACETWGVGCIDSGSTAKPSFSTYIRMAYHAYNGYEKLAYVFTHDIATNSKLKWGEMTAANALLAASTTPGQDIVGQTNFQPNVDLFSPAITYDCRETLHIHSYMPVSTSMQPRIAYRLRTDPQNTMRIIQGMSSLMNISPTWTMPRLAVDVSIPRTVFNVGVTSSGTGSSYQLVTRPYRLQNQAISLVYTANGGCTSTLSCTTNVQLGTVATCSNTLFA